MSTCSIRQQYKALRGVATHLLHVPSSQLSLTTTDSSDTVVSAEERAANLLSSMYDQIVTMDYLDISPDGIKAWDTAVKRYV